MRYYNPVQVARMLNISDKTVRRHIQKNTIQASRKASGELKIAEDQIEKLRVYLELDSNTQVSPVIDVSRQVAELEARIIKLEAMEHANSAFIGKLIERVNELEAKVSRLTAEQGDTQPVSTKPKDDNSQIARPQISNVEPNRDIRTITDLPEGTITTTEFRARYGINKKALDNYIAQGVYGQPLPLTKIPHPTRQGYNQTFFTPQQAEEAVELLRRYGKIKED